MNFYFLDFISPDVHLYYKGRTKHSSIFSVIISIISFIVLMILSVVFALEFILHKNPTAFYYNKFVDDIGVFYLNHSSFFHFVSFDNYSAYSKKAFSLVGVQNSIESTYIANNNESNFDHWIYDKCDKNDIGEYYNILDNYSQYFQHGLCVKKYYNSTLRKVILYNESDFVYPTVEHGASSTREIYYGVFIQRCQNNSEINSDCYDNNTIDNIIYSTISYSIFFIDHIIDIDNYKNPFRYFFHQILNKYSTLRKVILYNESYFAYPTVEHGASSTKEIYYGVFIQRCQNNSEINSDCYDNHTIDNIIYSTISYSIFFIDHIIDIDNYKNPFKHFFHQILNKYSTLSYTINVLNFQSLEIHSITGIIFESKKVINSYKYDKNEKITSKKSVEYLNDNIFGAFSLSMQNMQNVYSRKYKKLQDVAASIGGIIKIINFFSFLINYYLFLYKELKLYINLCL